jgi:chemosensory pili system protein ChpA (sensor histidine kinase/response regulator)
VLAAALKRVAQVEIDPRQSDFDKIASEVLSKLISQPERWQALNESLEHYWDEGTLPSWPVEPGPLRTVPNIDVADGLLEVEPSGSANDTSPQGAETTGRRWTVMVVDDSSSFRASLRDDLESSGYEALLAEDGWDALGQLESAQPPDLLLVDVFMPRMSGFELVEIIHRRERFRKVPIVMMTSDTSTEWELKMASSGASVLLRKPVKKADMLRQVAASLRQRS